MANNNWTVHRATMLGEQVLILNRIPFHIAFDRDLDRLAPHRVLFLTDQECLSDRDLARIKAFVEGGGGVVATGTTGAFDAWRRRRPRNGLAAALGFAVGAATRGTLGKGRFAYLPAIVPAAARDASGRPPANDSRARDRELSPDEWLPPANSAEIVDALRWAAGGPFTAEIQAPPAVVAEVTSDGTGRLRLVHLLNYDPARPASQIRIDLAVTPRVRSVTVLSPDGAAAGPVAFQQQNGRLVFQVPSLATYSLAVVGLAQ